MWLVLVYVSVTHGVWSWGGGWLGTMGLLDFTGGAVIHITMAPAALVAALIKCLRVNEEEKPGGLDIVSHEARGYDL